MFYIPPDHIQGNLVELPEEEERHAVQVLRHRKGDEIVAVDGEGGWYRVRLTGVRKKRAQGEVIEQKRDVGEPAYHLTIGMALLKNQNRFDVFVEKASELGVARIVPLLTERTEKQSLREKRVRKLLVASMKQCGRSRLVDIAPVETFDELISNASASLKLIAHEKASIDKPLLQEIKHSPRSSEVIILIGPEGGFSEEEVGRAVEVGFQMASLGPRRLRAETAAIVASTGVMIGYSIDN